MPNQNKPDLIRFYRGQQVQAWRMPFLGSEQLEEIPESCVCCYSLPTVPICRFTWLQQLHFAFLSWGLEMQSWGHLPVLNRSEGRVSLTEPRGFCPCWIYTWDWVSCDLKKHISFTHFSEGLSKDNKNVPESDRVNLILYFSTQCFYWINLTWKRDQWEIYF